MKLYTTEAKRHWCKTIMAEKETPTGVEVLPDVVNGQLRGFGSYAMMVLPCGCRGIYHREEVRHEPH